MKKEKELKESEINEDLVSDEWDLKSRTLRVANHGEKTDISSDHILSYNPESVKIFFKESRINAHWAKNSIFEKLAKNSFNYNWDDKKGDWDRDEDGGIAKIPISNIKRLKLKAMGSYVFDLLMLDPNTTIELNRNVKDNPMLSHVFDIKTEKEQPIGQMEPKNFFEKFKDKIKGEDETFEEN